MHASANGDLYGRANAKMQTLRRTFADCYFSGIGVSPPFTLGYLIACRRCIGPAQFGTLKHSAGEVLLFHLVERLPVERDESTLHSGEQVELLGDARLVLKEGPHSVDFVWRDVDKKDIGQF